MNVHRIRTLLPTAKDKDFLPPVIHDDGSLEYPKSGWEPPQVPNGFVRDAENKWLFHPCWPECDHRGWKVRVKPCGCIDLQALCLHRQAPTHKQFVPVETCLGCPFAKVDPMKKPCTGCPESQVVAGEVVVSTPALQTPPRYLPGQHPLYALRYTLPLDNQQREYPKPHFFPNGEIEYPRLADSHTPPETPEGYEVAEGNPWRFKPVWPDCQLRFSSVSFKGNGCIDLTMTCQNPEAKEFSKKVPCSTCKDCPVRKPIRGPAAG